MSFEGVFESGAEHTAFAAGENWLAGQLERVCDNRREIARLEADEVRLLLSLLDEAEATAAEEAYECGDHGEVTRRYDLRVRSHATELAASLHISLPAAELRLAEAWTLRHELDATLAALEAGEISRGHVHDLITETSHLAGAAVRQQAEAALLPWARRLAPAPFRKKAKQILETLEKDSLKKRHERAFAKRRVEVTAARDGMAHLHAYIELTAAARIKAGLENAAQEARAAGDMRTAGQLEADFTVELLLDGNITIGTLEGTDGKTAKPVKERAAVTVDVLIPVETLAGKNTHGAVIPALGAIDPVKARELVALAPSLRRILTDPITGAILDFDRKTYRVPAELKRILKLRDGHCRAPACTLPLKNTELDHTTAYAKGGTTALTQLAHLCDNHHHLKHEAGWHLAQYLDGVLHWRAPSGRSYRTYPEPRTPAPPPHSWDISDTGEPAPFDAQPRDNAA